MGLQKLHHPYISDLRIFQQMLLKGISMGGKTVQNLDFSKEDILWNDSDWSETLFMGCTFRSEQDEFELRKKGALIFQRLEHLPYNPYRKTLYSWQELMEGMSDESDNSLDLQIYSHFSASRYNPELKEALSQRIHDHAVEHALRELLKFDDEGMTTEKCVGFMGGHGTLRTDPFFRKTAEAARLLAREGYFVVSGGGPGIMEAANLGGYFGHQPLSALHEALEMLSAAPHYTDRGYLAAARNVLEKFPDGNDSLAIPTWFYGHEPSNLFASHIAKLFSNSIREDALLAVCLYGVIFSPGSAGTTQEIFQDAAQNHYGTLGYYSPMVFLGKKRYEIDTLIYPLLKQLAWEKEYNEMLYITDEPTEVLEFIQNNPPIPKSESK